MTQTTQTSQTIQFMTTYYGILEHGFVHIRNIYGQSSSFWHKHTAIICVHEAQRAAKLQEVKVIGMKKSTMQS